jgi:hypothetical protein
MAEKLDDAFGRLKILGMLRYALHDNPLVVLGVLFASSTKPV